MRFLLLLGLGNKKHLKIKETCNYYFKTIGYCSITKVKSSLIKKVLCNLALGTNAWFKMLLLIWTLLRSGPSCYVHSCAFYKRCPFNHAWGLSELKKAKTKTKTIQVHLLLYQSGHVCERVYDDSLCQMLLRDLNNWSKNISMVYYLSSIASETSAYNVMLI